MIKTFLTGLFYTVVLFIVFELNVVKPLLIKEFGKETIVYGLISLNVMVMNFLVFFETYSFIYNKFINKNK